jgi:translation initiation factor 5A
MAVTFTTPSELRKNNFVLLKDRPCKIREISGPVVTSKHGHAKYIIIALDVFTEKKRKHCFTGHDRVTVPQVIKSERDIIDISSDGYMSLLLDDGGSVVDVKVGNDIVDHFSNDENYYDYKAIVVEYRNDIKVMRLVKNTY